MPHFKVTPDLNYINKFHQSNVVLLTMNWHGLQQPLNFGFLLIMSHYVLVLLVTTCLHDTIDEWLQNIDDRFMVYVFGHTQMF